jgi:hypothetical protein
MKNLINIAIVSLTLLISNYALADFQDGLNAYDKQDYDAAFEKWQPLAYSQDYIVHLHFLAQLLFDTKTQLA